MCGIAGFISKQNDAPLRERELLLDRMCRTIRHRGPDQQGTLVEGRAALGMRRLSIIDLKTGQQPIFSCDNNLAIVFNGEIYNFQELKKELEQLGHRFKTNSDTETIVHAYEEFGEKCLDKLRGMFAFAIWDKRAEKLFLARDRAGKKPLFYAAAENNFVFGSELKVLLETGEVECKLDSAALDSYLTFGYVPDDLCIFENVKKLPAGHFLIFERGATRVEQYWDFPAPSAAKLDERETITELQRLLDEAVKIRLVAEVPLGAFLSGGVDSSAIVGLMSRHVERVKTFSIGFDEDRYDELKFARLTAAHFNTEHHEFTVTPEMVGEIDNLIEHFDEPFADMSALPTFFVAKLAREFVTVALTGDGGDELFAGYTRYANQQKQNGLSKLPRLLRRSVLQTVAANLPSGARGKNYLHNASLDSLDRYIDSISHFNKANRKQLYAPDFRAKMNGSFGAGEEIFERIGGRLPANSLASLLYLDAKTYLSGDILTKVDRMTMAASLEARAPLLDHKLIEFAATIPANLKLKNLETKYIFKEAVRGLVPDEILDRPKQGFGVPLDVWINQTLSGRIEEVLRSPEAGKRGFFAPEYVENLLAEHRRGRRDNAWRLWALFVLELWLRRFVDGK